MTSLPFTAEEREFASAVQRVSAANPFLPERIEGERAALGAGFEEREADWNTRPPSPEPNSNHAKLMERCAQIVERLRARWPKGGPVTDQSFVIPTLR